MSIGILRIPSRFEALKEAVGPARISQVLVEATEDLLSLKQAIAEVETSGQAKLVFLRGNPGAGKTSLAESTSIFLADVVGGVLSPPPDYEISLQALPSWLATHIPDARTNVGNKILVVNLDGREIPTLDEAATNAAMVNLNALLRRYPKMLLTWPVIDERFANEAINRLQAVGARSALVSSPIHEIRGVSKNRYFDVLNLLLRATALKLEDAAISNEEARSLVDDSDNIGEYLTQVQSLVVARYDLGELGTKLPVLYIVFSANEDTTSICRQLRRGIRYLADSDRLIQFSRANVAEDWKERGRRNPRKGLSFITSLFELRVLNVSSSSVVNACAFGDDAYLRQLVRQHYPNPVSSNAATLLKGSSLVRALTGQEDVASTTSNPSAQIKRAYQAIQNVTNLKHRQINESIMKVITNQLGINLGEVRAEYQPIPDKGLTADIWIRRNDRPEAIEFTHQSRASEAVLSSYLLYKLQDYARDYGLL